MWIAPVFVPHVAYEQLFWRGDLGVSFMFRTAVFARDSIYAKRAYAIAILSVSPPVCHTGGSVKNGWS